MLTIAPIADASVSWKGGDKNVGKSNRLYVTNDGSGEWQLLLLFNLHLVAESFGPVVGLATLIVYSASDSHLEGATLKKMAGGDWTERGVAWDDVAGHHGFERLRYRTQSPQN